MGLLDEAIREHLDLKRRRGADPAEIEKAEREALGPVRREPTASAPVAYHDEEPVLGSHAYDEPGVDADEYDEPSTDLHDYDYDEPAAADSAYDETPAVAPVDEVIDFETVEPERSAPQPTAPPEQLVEERRTPKRRSLLHRRHRETEAPAPADEHEQSAPVPAADDFGLGHDDPFFSGEHESYEHVHRDFDEPDDQATEVHPAPTPPAGAPPPVGATPPPAAPAEYEDDYDFEPAAQEPVQRHEPTPPPAASRASEPVAPDDPILGETVEYDVEQAMRDDEDEILEETPEFLQDTPDHDRLWFEQKPPKDFDI